MQHADDTIGPEPTAARSPVSVTFERPWHATGDPVLRRSGVLLFGVGALVALAVLAAEALAHGLPEPIVWAFALAIIATDITELPVSTDSGGRYKVVLNDALVLAPFAVFATHDVAWLLLVVTSVSWLLLAHSWSMRFAHVTSGLAYRLLLWGTGAATVALGGSPYVAVGTMALASVLYEFTLFWPFAHVLIDSKGSSYREFARDALPIQALMVGFDVPLALLAVATLDDAPWAVPLLAVPILLVWRLALLAPQVETLQAADRMKSRFVSMASHELQTPLTSIVGFAATLDDRWTELDDDDRRSFLRIIRTQGERLSRIVSELLVLSRIEAGAPTRPSEQVDVADAVAEAARDCPAPVVTVEGPRSGIHAWGRRDELVRILVNLLSNAHKYGRPPFVVGVDEDGDEVVLRVVDHGSGVAAEDEDRLFEQFARGSDVATDVEGSGLGLAIARSLARSQGGDVTYVPGAPAGTTFEVRLRSARGLASSTPESRSSAVSSTSRSVPSSTSGSSVGSSTGE